MLKTLYPTRFFLLLNINCLHQSYVKVNKSWSEEECKKKEVVLSLAPGSSPLLNGLCEWLSVCGSVGLCVSVEL